MLLKGTMSVVSILSGVEAGPFVVVAPVAKMGGAGGNSVLSCRNCSKGPVAGWDDSPKSTGFCFLHQVRLELKY
jgi:hypothetical protein